MQEVPHSVENNEAPLAETGQNALASIKERAPEIPQGLSAWKVGENEGKRGVFDPEGLFLPFEDGEEFDTDKDPETGTFRAIARKASGEARLLGEGTLSAQEHEELLKPQTEDELTKIRQELSLNNPIREQGVTSESVESSIENKESTLEQRVAALEARVNDIEQRQQG